MKWMRGRLDGRESWGRLEGDDVLVHEGDLARGLQPTGERWPLGQVQMLMPCQPRTMLGLWNNFQALAEKNNWARPAEPLYFLKAPGSWTGPDTAIPAPSPEVGRIAYEGELAVVIGRRAHRVTVEEAPAHIFGYTCANDVTAMELLNRDASFAQWTRAKG
ncbi:MAG: fumarylacetoacetate hydrolase family protein, partial [Rubrivivax sp.]